MKHLKTCVWVGPSKNQMMSSSKPVQSKLEELVKPGVDVEFQMEDFWVFGHSSRTSQMPLRLHGSYLSSMSKSSIQSSSRQETLNTLTESGRVGLLEGVKSLVRYLEPRVVYRNTLPLD